MCTTCYGILEKNIYMYNVKVVYNSCFLPNTLSSNLLASAVLNVDDFEASGRVW